MIQLNPSEPDPVLTWVRGELQRFGEVIATEMDTLRTDLEAERSSRAALETQITQIAEAVENSAANSGGTAEFVERLEQWINEFEQASDLRNAQLTTKVNEALASVDSKIASQPQGGSGPDVKDLELRQEQVESAMEATRSSLVKFDEQAARMVSYFSESVDSMRVEISGIADGQSDDVEGRFAALEAKVDETSTAVSNVAQEAASAVGGQVDSAEDRINSRMMALEMRVQDDIGTRVADMDAHVGRIGAGLDDSVTMLNDRIVAIDGKFADVESDLAAARKMIESVDEEAIDDMKEKISSALGQAELVRIEMERFQETVTSNLEKTAVRLTDIETTVQDQAMDVETAVQLERLEEVERAVLMLDPDIIRPENDADGDDVVAMSRPNAQNETATGAAASSPAASSAEKMAPPPAAPSADEMAPPPASSPLSPPTAEPQINAEPGAHAAGAVDHAMSLEPPVNL